MVRGETESKSLDMFLQVFFDRILVFQLDFKLEVVAILRLKKNNLEKKKYGRKTILGAQGDSGGHKVQSSNLQPAMQLMFGPQNIYFKP